MAALRAFKSGMMSLLLSALLMGLRPLICEALIYQRTRVSQCIPIKETLCQGNYTFTLMPNILGHETPEEASARLAEFKPLIENECSPHVTFFLCSLHFPMCVPQIPYGIPACREMCQEVRESCEPYMKAFHFEWPETIQCDKLKESATKSCLHPPKSTEKREERTKPADVIPSNPEHVDDAEDDEITVSDVLGGEKQEKERRKPKPGKRRKDRRGRTKTGDEDVKPKEEGTEEDEGRIAPVVTERTVEEPVDPVGVEIKREEEKEEQNEVHYPRWNPVNINQDPIYPEESPAEVDEYVPDYNTGFNQFVPTDSAAKKLKCKNPDKFIHVERLQKCLPVCEVKTDVMFSSSDKQFMYYWMLSCALFCIISSSLTVGTFLIDSKRFRYPERPIIFLSLCYLLYSSAYLVRLGRGPDGSVSCVTVDGSDVKHVVMGDLESTGCTAVIFLLYYFGMAAAVWWVIMSITWFLAAGLKWGHEAIEAHGFYFHLVAWLLPAIQTVVVFVLGKVDGDELTGLCYVGNLDMESLLYFVIVPLTTYLAVGALALGCGFLSLFKIRRVILRKSGGKDAGKLEKLMLKIGIFTVLYIVPAACVVAVNIYQYNNYDIWTATANSRPCYPPGFDDGSKTSYDRAYRNVPVYPPYYDRPQGYPQYDYDGQYLAQRPVFYYPPRYLLPDTYAGYEGYSDTYAPGYRRNPVSYQSDIGYRAKEVQDPGYEHTYGAARPFYNGRGIVAVPPHLTPHHPYTGRQNRRKQISPLPYDPQMAQNLQQAYVENANPSIKNTQFSTKAPDVKPALDCHLEESIPSFPIFAIKIFMSMLAGITSGIWVWSGKTYKSWKRFCRVSWCGKRRREKGSDVTSNTPHATSCGNVNAPASVTSQMLSKTGGRPSPDGELPSPNGKRFSYPVPLSDRYRGYHPVKHDDDHHNNNDVAALMSSTCHQGQTTGLTLGDIAREYSDNLDSEYREVVESPRNETLIVSQSYGDDIIGDVMNNHKSHSKMRQKNLKLKKKQLSLKNGPNAGSRDSPMTYPSQLNRAVPNVYEDTASQRRFRYSQQTSRDVEGAYAKPQALHYGKSRVRKYSETDAKKLSLVSGSGFNSMSGETRKKAHSAHVSTMVRM